MAGTHASRSLFDLTGRDAKDGELAEDVGQPRSWQGGALALPGRVTSERLMHGENCGARFVPVFVTTLADSR